ncbi:MAG: GLUG motif-containing protein [Enterobacteriaceae bacterium]
MTQGEQSRAGGLIGYLDGGISINNSYARGDVYAYQTENNPVHYGSIGGLIGYGGQSTNSSFPILQNSFATGNIVTNGRFYVGGLIGTNTLKLMDSIYYSGNIEASVSKDFPTSYKLAVGGLVGNNWSSIVNTKISNAYASGSIVTEGISYIGGLIGYHRNNQTTTQLSDSYSRNTITTIDDIASGTLVGYNQGIINNSHSTATLNGEDGPLIGDNQGELNL